MGRPETVPASGQGVGRPEDKPEKKGPVGPPETVPVRKGNPQTDAPKAEERPAQQGQGSEVAAAKRNHGRINKWLNEFDQLVSAIQSGQEVSVNKVEKALHLTQKLAGFLEDKSRLPDDRTQQLVTRLKGFTEVFTQYLAQQASQSEPAPATPPTDSAPVQSTVEELPPEGVVV
jgi:hypothetical protein